MENLKLSRKSLRSAVDQLCENEVAFARVVKEYGYPPMWDRDPGFQTILHIILEQQVSLASAKATLDKLLDHVDSLSPESFLELDDQELRGLGFSRQKARYGRVLAERFLSDGKSFSSLPKMPDDEAYKFLLSLTGIGPWTAQVYQLMVLRRPDIWPIGDRALAVAIRETFELKSDPSDDEQLLLAESWRPWRSAAARILWLGYLGRRGKLDLS